MFEVCHEDMTVFPKAVVISLSLYALILCVGICKFLTHKGYFKYKKKDVINIYVYFLKKMVRQ